MMDIYDCRNDDPKDPEGVDWEEIIAFTIAAIILALSVVGLVTVIRILL